MSEETDSGVSISRPKPPALTETLTYRLDKPSRGAVERLAKKLKIEVAELVRVALQEKLERDG